MGMIARGVELLFRVVFGFSFLFCLGLGLFFLNLDAFADDGSRRADDEPGGQSGEGERKAAVHDSLGLASRGPRRPCWFCRRFRNM